MVNDIEITLEPLMEFFPEEPFVEKRHGVVVEDTGTVRSMGTEVGDVRMGFTETGTIVNGSGRSIGFTIAYDDHSGVLAVGDSIVGSLSDAGGSVTVVVDDAPPTSGGSGTITGFYFAGENSAFDITNGEDIVFTGGRIILAADITAITHPGIGRVFGSGNANGGGSMRVDIGSVRAPHTEFGTVKAGS